MLIVILFQVKTDTLFPDWFSGIKPRINSPLKLNNVFETFAFQYFNSFRAAPAHLTVYIYRLLLIQAIYALIKIFIVHMHIYRILNIARMEFLRRAHINYRSFIVLHLLLKRFGRKKLCMAIVILCRTG